MKGKFKIFRNGKVEAYADFNDIPQSFNHLIQCEFDIPEPPHTEEEHELIESFKPKMQELLGRQNGN